MTMKYIIRIIGMVLIQIGLFKHLGWRAGLVAIGIYWITMSCDFTK